MSVCVCLCVCVCLVSFSCKVTSISNIAFISSILNSYFFCLNDSHNKHLPKHTIKQTHKHINTLA